MSRPRPVPQQPLPQPVRLLLPRSVPLPGLLPDSPLDSWTFMIESFSEALELAHSLVDVVPMCGCAVRLDDDGRPLDVLRVDGDPLDLAPLVEETLTDTSPTGMQAGAVFFVSIGADVMLIDMDELTDSWLRLRDLFEGSGIELLDWLVESEGLVQSMALETGAGGRW